MTPEACAPEPAERARLRRPRFGTGRPVALVGILVAAGLTFAMWREAVDWRATSGDGHILGWALPSSAGAAMLVLWLITAVLDADRPRTVRLLTAALVATTLLGWWAVVAATSDVTVGR